MSSEWEIGQEEILSFYNHKTLAVETASILALHLSKEGLKKGRLKLRCGSPGFMVYTVSSTTVCDSMMPSE